MFRGSKKIEKINSQIYFNHINPSQFENFKRKEPRKVLSKDLKSVSIKFAFKTGWYLFGSFGSKLYIRSDLFDGNEIINGFQVHFRELPKIMNPMYLSLTFDK